MKRTEAARIAADTMQIVAAGRYTNPVGDIVPVRELVETAQRGTVSYPPDAAVPKAVPAGRATRFEVTNETTLAAARRLAAAGHRVVALNFASARKPGGGFLNGAVAQEESLCRSSALYACLAGNPMYAFHAPLSGGMYTNYAIYSPDVPVFKTDDGELLDQPYVCSFITAPAVNAGVLRPDEESHVRGEMERRVKKVLAVAAGQGHAAVVLGAWGCGVFKNDPEMIVELFRQALVTRFAGVFEVVAFAVLDRSADGGTIRPFAERFGAVNGPPG